MERIYFDHASTTPVDPQVIEAMMPFFHERFGNASSPHGYGQEAKKALEDARESLAALIGAGPDEIIFNSGATEANNHAVLGLVRSGIARGKHIIVSAIEHHSVLEPVEYLRSHEGFEVTYVRPEHDGCVDPSKVENAITDETALVAVMHASNEIGTIQPVAEIGALTRERRIPFLVDAVQTVGHIPVDVNALNADALSLSAHKFYGPKGVGALYVRRGVPVEPFILGGDQERGRRASTQNIAGVVGLACAAGICGGKMDEEAEAQAKLRDRLLKEVPQRVPGVTVNGHLTRRLPNNAHFSFAGVQGESLLMSLDMAGIAASMGSACTSGAMEPSHVLRAIGLSDEEAFGALRVTVGRWTTGAQTEYFLMKLPEIIKGLRL